MSMNCSKTCMTREEFMRKARIAVMYGKIETIERFPSIGWSRNEVEVGVSVATGMPVINPGTEDTVVGTVTYTADDEVDVENWTFYDDTEIIRGYDMYADAYDRYARQVQECQKREASA